MREILKRKNISQKTFKTCSTMHNTPFPLVLFKSYAKDFLSFFLDFTLKTSPLPNRKHCSLFSFKVVNSTQKKTVKDKKKFLFLWPLPLGNKKKRGKFWKKHKSTHPKEFSFLSKRDLKNQILFSFLSCRMVSGPTPKMFFWIRQALFFFKNKVLFYFV